MWPHRRFAPLLPHTLRRIPQAVGIVATKKTHIIWNLLCQCFNTVNGRCYCLITFVLPSLRSGKQCCNWLSPLRVTILLFLCFNTVYGRYCCNMHWLAKHSTWFVKCFNTVNSRYCCLSPLFYLHFVQVLEMCGPHRRSAPLPSLTLRRIP